LQHAVNLITSSRRSQSFGRPEPLVKCLRISLAVSGAPQTRRHSIRRPGGRPRMAFEFLPPRSTWSEVAGQFRLTLKRAHLAPGDYGAAARSAFANAALDACSTGKALPQ